jgi:hypothetical protein
MTDQSLLPVVRVVFRAVELSISVDLPLPRCYYHYHPRLHRHPLRLYKRE